MIDEVRLRGTTFVIERDGRPAVAVVPLSVLERLDAERGAAFEELDALRKKVGERISAEDLDALLAEELKVVRASSRADARST